MEAGIKMIAYRQEDLVSGARDLLLRIAVDAALEAGSAILDVYRSDDFDVQVKSDDSPLTRADRLAHALIVKRLGGGAGKDREPVAPPSHPKPQVTNHKSRIPESRITHRHVPSTIHHPLMGHLVLPILSEEGAHIPYEERKTWSRFWLVDPLDGTKEFIKRNGEFTVNIALIEAQGPVMGVVYAPVPDLLYYGDEHLGAFRLDHAADYLTGPEERPSLESLIARSHPLPLRKHKLAQDTEYRVSHPPSTIHREAALRVVASRSHMNEETRAFIQDLEMRYGPVELVQAGSSLKLCLVAEGSADLYPRLGPTMEWDTAAADAVVRAAGGAIVSHGPRKPLTYNKESLLNPYFVVVGSTGVVSVED